MNFNNGFRITGNDLTENSFFGYSTSVNSAGNIALVGAQGNSSFIGAAYIFTGSKTSWTQIAKLTGSNATTNDRFGYSVSLNSAGNIALVGAINEDPNGFGAAGAAYVFTGSGNNWIQTARITGSNPAGVGNFGFSTSLNSAGNVALVGAINEDPNSISNAGTAYIFTGSGSNWVQVSRITGNDLATNDYFGYSVSLNSAGNVALVGSAGDDIGAISDAGSAYIFTGSGSNWAQVAKITGSGVTSDGYFGQTVSLNSVGNIALIGAPRSSINGLPLAGAVYIFTGNGSNWIQAARITGSMISDFFGTSVSINSTGNIALIGAYGGDFASPAYIFSGSGSNWTQVAKITGSGVVSNDYFGQSVSLNSGGNVMLVGAYLANPNGVSDAGSAYIFTEKLNQTITFNSLDAKSFGDSLFYLTGFSDSNLALTYSSSNIEVARITGGSGVLITGVGTSIITGSQTGNQEYNAATPVARTLTVNKANQTISFSAIPTKNFGDSSFFLDATTTSNLPITFSGSNSSVATIVGSGVTIVGGGTCEITGYQTGNFNYNAATPVARTLNVLRSSQTINLSSFYTGIYNETKVYDASTPQGLPLIYTGNTNIFSIAANNITFINTGITILTGYNTGSTNYTGITGTQQVTVNRANAIIDFPYIPVFNISVTSGYTLNATSNHNESTITYTSSNSGAASISGANTLLITGTGVGIITAYQPATSHYNEASGQRSFTALDVRNPQIIAVSNLPNNVFFDTGSKYLQGYLQDEGTYHLKLHILEDNILCEKTIVLNVIDTGVKHLYKINYPINIGFIKYNAPQRLGL